MLEKRKIPHNVLNARYHEQEAYIIAQAGAPGGITIATNMAGRGTDIQLGGNVDMRIDQEIRAIENDDGRESKEAEIHTRITGEVAANREIVLEAGGLYVLGTERHEARRIDNQLRGRSGRQGDPGKSKFFLSLEDDLMRIFGSERIDTMLRKLGLEEGEAIVHPWINKALEKAQKKVEERNFEIRKNLLKFDNVMNDQRKVIYEQRKELMQADDVSDDVQDMRHDTVDGIVARCIPERAYPEQWDVALLHDETFRVLGLDLPVTDWAQEEGIADEEIRERVNGAGDRLMAEKAANYTPEIMRLAEKELLLHLLDQTWKEHLLGLDHLRQGIGLRAYGQKDPLNEYKREAFDLFEEMLNQLRETVTTVMCHLELQIESPGDFELMSDDGEYIETRDDPALQGGGRGRAETGGFAGLHPAAAMQRSAEPMRVLAATADADELPPGWTFYEPLGRYLDPADPGTWGKVPRNAACPCAAGKKYKHCHGRVA